MTFVDTRWTALDGISALPAYRNTVAGALLIAAGAALILSRHPGIPAVTPAKGNHSRHAPRPLVRYPLQTGAVLASAGVALALGSSTALWIGTPLLAIVAAASAIARRTNPAATERPLLALPAADTSRPDIRDIASAHALLFWPWLALYAAVESLGVPRDAVVGWQSWEERIPVLPWTELLYASAYPFTLAVPFVAATRADLRAFMVRGWIGIALIIPIYLLVPIIAPARPVPGDGVLQTLMRWEREYDSPVTAFPAFHVVWVLLSAHVYSRRWRRLAGLWWLLAAAISVSCVTVGMHATIDVVGGAAAFLAIIYLHRFQQRLEHRVLPLDGTVQTAPTSPVLPWVWYATTWPAVLLLGAGAIAPDERLRVAAAFLCMAGAVAEAALRVPRVLGERAGPRELYIGAWTLLLAAGLIRLWVLDAGVHLVVGAYLVGSGAARIAFSGERLKSPAGAPRQAPRRMTSAAIIIGFILALLGWPPAS